MRNKWRQRVFVSANGLEHISVTTYKNFAKKEAKEITDKANCTENCEETCSALTLLVEEIII